MKKIYILLMHTNTIPSNIVRFFTGYKYSHVALSLDKECIATYSFGRKKLNSILNGGFVEQYKDGEFFKKFNNTSCSIYEIEVTDEKYYQIEALLNEMKKDSEKYKYDFIGLICRYFNIKVVFRNHYVCSYFVAEILKDAGICEFDKEVCFVKPKDFEDLEGFKKVYTGSYNLYNNIGVA